MPPASNTGFSADRLRSTPFGTSPDTDNPATEPEILPQLSKKAKKKKARNAAPLQHEYNPVDEPHNGDLIAPSPLPSPPPNPPSTQSLLSQIPRGFSRPAEEATLPEEFIDSHEPLRDRAPTHVTDQYPFADEKWMPDEPLAKNDLKNTTAPSSHGGSPQVQPGFSTRVAHSTKSPPVSPPQRYSRPVSYGGSIPPMHSHPRMSSSPYSRTTSFYGSPPAPHLPQQHFYHAKDVDLGLPQLGRAHTDTEPSLVKQTVLPSQYSQAKQGILLGYEGRISLLAANQGKLEEIGAMTNLSGSVIDAVLLSSEFTPGKSMEAHPLIAIVLHGPREVEDLTSGAENASGALAQLEPTTGTEYSTRCEIYSLSSKQRVARLLETPSAYPQPAFRGALPGVPLPIGNLKLFAARRHLVVTSGTSGEVFIFRKTGNASFTLECVGKLWANLQPQTQRRDSSHGRSIDSNASPADPQRGLLETDRAIVDLNGRWLAISPASAPSRPSLGAFLGNSVVYSRSAGVESVAPPARPSITCEVDSPDADTLLGKVARGVAQELVKGAKWLGDQGYQTWQNYWKKEQSPPASLHQHSYNTTMHPVAPLSNNFPPTHGDATMLSKEPDLVSIFDLCALQDAVAKKSTGDLRPMATYQPPRGCSFLSFAPNGLSLLTASKKGDVQYVWDLMQMRYCRAFVTTYDDTRISPYLRVRQIARYERLSGSTIIDVVWEPPNGTRFVALTKNRTIHMFDLPLSALRWPPPRSIRRPETIDQSADALNNAQEGSQSGFFASAMSIASKAQPMVSGWRGRAPSISGGLTGLGQTGIGIATATGARGSKAVAAGLSRSLGAASETVNHIRHAGESRIHLKARHEVVAGRVYWARHGRKSGLVILDREALFFYQVVKPKVQDRGRKERASVFTGHKAGSTKMMGPHELRTEFETFTRDVNEPDSNTTYPGFCKMLHVNDSRPQAAMNPLSFAEVETNAPFQPFHSDRRVLLSVFNNSDGAPTKGSTGRRQNFMNPKLFGDDISVIPLNIHRAQLSDEDEGEGSVIYRETVVATSSSNNGQEQIVSTTRRSKKKRHTNSETLDPDGELEKDDFFEDDCEVLDFATDRV